MKKQRTLILIILLIFITGMTLAPATASHTIKAGKYTATISDKQYKKLKKGAKGGEYYDVKVKTKQTYTVKKPKYKTKKVKKWKYKKVLDNEFVYYPGGCDYHDYHTMKKYSKKGWEWCGSSYKTIDYGDGYSTTKYYYKFKKKITVNKKVKSGYKVTGKKHYTMYIECNGDVWVYKGNAIVDNYGIKI